MANRQAQINKLVEETKHEGPHDEPLPPPKTIAESDYQKGRHRRQVEVGAKRSYQEVMKAQIEENEAADAQHRAAQEARQQQRPEPEAPAKRQKKEDDATTVAEKPQISEWDRSEASQVTKKVIERSARGGMSKWDTPARIDSFAGATPKVNRWDLTPMRSQQGEASRMLGETPTPARWAQATPRIGQTPLPSGGRFGETPVASQRGFMQTPAGGETPMPGMEPQAPSETTQSSAPQFEESRVPMSTSVGEELPDLKPEDVDHFRGLLTDGEDLSSEEAKERKIMVLLLKIKNGTPPMRKQAFKTITEKAREFGAAPLLNKILPLLMSPSLEDQERHLLVKAIDRILYQLKDLVRPHVREILAVIEPLLIDEDYYARVEGREIISNLAKAAGLTTMISTMRPDIDHNDEFVRNTTSRAFAVIASSLGIPAILPFLRAVCASKKKWRARHTGIKIVQQIAILMGCAVLPHLKHLVEIIEHGLRDEEQKVRTITALALSALAEASAPYGIEAFDSVLVPLWDGIPMYRGKALAAFLKAIGYIIPLMDPEHAGEYTKFVTPVLIREFQNNDDEMKKIVLKVVKQCVATEGVSVQYIREELVPAYFSSFWVRRNAVDKKNYKQLIETTVEIAGKVGGAEIVRKIVDDIKDENEAYRKIVLETLDRILANFGVADLDSKLEQQIVEGVIFAFQYQASEDSAAVLNAFGTVVNSLGARTKPYISQICGTIQWIFNNKSALVRQLAADLIQRIAGVMKTCGEEALLGRMGVILYEYLGEEYPEVLGSLLGGLKAIVNVIGMTKMTPPIKDLLPRLTPILKNRHEKVQENCIELVGRIADRGAEYVSAREWMRICFDLLDLLRAHKKSIRRAAVNTFGYIAKAIGPQDVLATLLNNLRVQERQDRVCTTVAIAIVSETCGPFTVLPALMNEYRVPEMNVQNGVLKSLSFMFEYIGEMGKDYILAITPLLEDALVDRDLVHRQTAASAVKHLALGVANLGCEDCLAHLINYLFPNVFEVSPHVINAVLEGIEGLRVSLGPGRLLLYVMQGLFHPARRVREVYWKIYNNMYLGSQDALVGTYPEFKAPGAEAPSEGKPTQYLRSELNLII